MSKALPTRPDLNQLRKQAKDLLKSLKSADAEAVDRLRTAHPRFQEASQAKIRAAKLSLSDAQLVVAREYGFASWPKLKARVESLAIETGDPIELFRTAFHSDDAVLFRKLLERFPEMRAKINEPVGPFDSPAITQARSPQMLDALLDAGADINAKSRWWAGGFGLLHSAEPELAEYAIRRGAMVDAHAAARLGFLDTLRGLLAANPARAHERGGDGQTPLHFASNVPIAELLLQHGADVDARDLDHGSTPVQWMIRERQDVAKHLVKRGCKTDILMAAALGDIELVRRHLDTDPESIRMRVTSEYFPMIDHRAGGTIYQWTLGWYVSAHDVARQFGHESVLSLLMDRSPADVKLVAECWRANGSAVREILKQNPGLAARLPAPYLQDVARAARNNNLPALRVLLEAGLLVDSYSQNATPLHWAAFHGNAEMTRVILRYNPPLELADPGYQSTPLGWAIYGSVNGWHRETGDYPATVEALLKAGAKIPEKFGGTEAVNEVIRRFPRVVGTANLPG
jgi:Ankyrin repeats (3 copies)/Ankyrin repeat